MTVIDNRFADVTVSTSFALVTPLSDAVMLVVPAKRPLASPCVPAELLTVATVVLDDAQVTVEVMFCVLLSA